MNRSACVTLGRHYLLAGRLRKMASGDKLQIKPLDLQKFLLTDQDARHGVGIPKVKKFSVRIGVA